LGSKINSERKITTDRSTEEYKMALSYTTFYKKYYETEIKSNAKESTETTLK
jgi:hypothetical protein